jgi:predicted RNase H-like HicB family nuclease
MEYQCIIKQEDGLYGVEFPDLPNIITVGTTYEEAVAMAGEALNAALESDVARGLPLPEPATGPGEGLVGIEVSPHIILAWEIRPRVILPSRLWNAWLARSGRDLR